MSAPIVDTTAGPIEGKLERGHQAYRGIPFAAPPVGARRFAAPEPPEPWTALRAAHAYGPSAVQGEAFAPGAAAEEPTGEDCLYLNVYTPAADARRRPVLVFIHGGGFIVGSSSQPLYDGGRLAELGDQVVVTFNYRLGAFGYLYLGEAGARWGAAANAGTLDQLAALRWVQANIERFGGNPADVTVFGESAGATSAIHLMAIEGAAGLFQRVIAQSPALGIHLAEPDVALGFGEQLLRALGLSLADSDRLRELPARAIRQAQLGVRGRPNDWLGFFPVLDAATVSRQPRELFAAGGGARVPLVIGHNRDEWNLFDLPTADEATQSLDLAAALAERFPPHARERLPELIELYRRSRTEKGMPHRDVALRRAILGDLRFRIPSLRIAELHSGRDLPTYAYLFSYTSPALRGALGACHALELPFVFGNHDLPLQDRFAGKGPAVEALSGEMMRAWTSFGARGVPSDGWPRFDAARRATWIFATPSRLENAPLDDERAAWDGIL